MSNQRVVNFAFFAFAALLFFVTSELLDQLWVYFELKDVQVLGFLSYPRMIGLGIAVVVTALLRRDNRANSFLLEATEEIRAIVWPDRKEVFDSTRVVIVSTIFLAAVLGGFDFIWAKVARFILE